MLPGTSSCSAACYTNQLFVPLQVSETGKESLPGWLHWDASARTLQGLPLEEDRGVHYISVSIYNSTTSFSSSEVFSIEVHPEDVLDSGVLTSADAQTFVCEDEEPLTLLTVIIDADLKKMSSSQRVELLDNMKSFSGGNIQQMKMLPVVNNRLFDMSAFMAGPGNAKKVSQNFQDPYLRPGTSASR